MPGSLDLLDIIENSSIDPYFQPIVDLQYGYITGYEMLARGTAPFASPMEMFAKAREAGLSWEIEQVCRQQSLRKIAALNKTQYANCQFFLNISPDILVNKPTTGFTKELLARMGIDQQRIVLEITEADETKDVELFENMIRHYVDQGFQIALDDFGTGYSNLSRLVTVAPNFLKLDRSIISNIHQSSYKQNLVKCISKFAHSVGSKLIAEGIESVKELETLMRLEVRYGQGFMLARPAATPPALTDAAARELVKINRRQQQNTVSGASSIGKLAACPPHFPTQTLTCEDADHFFRANHRADHIVLVEAMKPVGMITRNQFYNHAGGQFGYSLIQKKTVDSLASQNIITLPETTSVSVVGRLAMERPQDTLYHPVVVTNEKEELIGTVTMKQLLSSFIDLELAIASNSNPLTKLPGNMTIHNWMQSLLLNEKFTLVYADLDNFKEYNDAYGFPMGDDVIRFTADTMTRYLSELENCVGVGHIGGDDFVAMFSGAIEDKILSDLCYDFDQGKGRFFNAEDIDKSYYYSTNRSGERVQVPLVALSLAVLTEKNFGSLPHPGAVGEAAAEVKKKVKTINRLRRQSGFLYDRRVL